MAGGPGHGLDYRQTLTGWLPRTGRGWRPRDPVETQLVRGSPVPGGARHPGLQRVAAEADVQGRGLESAS